ncbi:MAG: hypothetical protein ACXAB2_06715 [Candidatus Hodarchaeales archaeon]|jgi:hypothetical protein
MPNVGHEERIDELEKKVRQLIEQVAKLTRWVEETEDIEFSVEDEDEEDEEEDENDD